MKENNRDRDGDGVVERTECGMEEGRAQVWESCDRVRRRRVES